MSGSKKYRVVPVSDSVLLILLFFFIASFSLFAADERKSREVLVFFSHPMGTPWQDQLSTSLNEMLKNDPVLDVEISADFPWIDPHHDDRYNDLLIGFYKYKYEKHRFDLIISTSTASTVFLLEFADILFPGIPVIALPGPGKDLVRQVEEKRNWTGVYSEKKIEETLDIGLHLNPGTEHIAVISGSTVNGKILEDSTRQIIQNNAYSQDFLYLSNMPMTEVLQRVSRLPDHTVIIYLTTLLDSQGNTFIPKDILKEITAAANAPVFGLWDTILASGVTGGYMVSPALDGKSLAELSLRILGGEQIGDIPVVKARNAYYFNWEQIIKWGIDERLIPPDSIIINREYSIWDQYKYRILMAVSAFILESLLIVFLLVVLVKFRRAKRALAVSYRGMEDKVQERTNDLFHANHELELEIQMHKEARVLVEELLGEKELILQEVHHRIKNNMSILSSLLALQAADIDNREAERILEDTGHRIDSMMVLYDKLYKGTDYRFINIREYLGSLISEIIGSMDYSENIRVETDIHDFELDSKIVFNLGIILNELLTNSIKYAFDTQGQNLIFIRASSTGNHVIMEVGDNGKGMPEGCDSRGFGLELVQVLVEQLEGKMKIEKKRGTSFILEFDHQR